MGVKSIHKIFLWMNDVFSEVVGNMTAIAPSPTLHQKLMAERLPCSYQFSPLGDNH
jgi:hypothetical protein